MSPRLPIAVRLTPAFARGHVKLGHLLRSVGGPDVRGQTATWRLSSREWAFARALLLHHTRLWLWRTDPKARAGDFLVLDMSSPKRYNRRAWVIDLKCLAPLKLGGGGAGISLIHADRAVAYLVEAGLAEPHTPRLATGDGAVLLALLTTPLRGPDPP
ncbi:MAG TPA: hypothetical protein ENK18_26030 [Deltaproteobacteria bacterium]|nr:hypothetical protein [Deltaproteobacteria bacterium]